MVRKFGSSDVFIVIEHEEHELLYHSNAIYESYNSEVVVTMELLNIAKLPTIHDCPRSPILHYYVELPKVLAQ